MPMSSQKWLPCDTNRNPGRRCRTRLLRRAAASCLGGLLLALGCAAAAAQPVDPAARQAPASAPISAQTQEDLRLLTGQNSIEARQIGAQRLLRNQTEGPEAIRRVLQEQPDPAVLLAVSKAMIDMKIGPAALVDPLLAGLASEDPNVRGAVIAALANCREHNLAARLTAVAETAANPRTQRLAAVAVLSWLADRNAIETLIELLDVQDEAVRVAALGALRQLTGVDFGADLQRWRRWWQSNRNRKPQEWMAELNASLVKENREKDEQIKHLRSLLGRAYRDLYYKTPEAEQPGLLVACLEHQVPDVRSVGIDLVNMLITDGKQVPENVADRLRRIIGPLPGDEPLRDPDPVASIRLQAVRVLADLRHRDDADRLLAALQNESEPTVEQAIVRALGRLGAPQAVEPLLARLDSGEPGMAASAAAGLGLLCQHGNPSIVPQDLKDKVVAGLAERLESAGDPRLRQETLEAMAKMADARFRSFFVAAVSAPDVALRQIGVKAFADLGTSQDTEQVLAPLLVDGEPAVREATCTALGKIGGKGQLPQLLVRCDPSAEASAGVRRAARDAAIAIMLRLDPAALQTELQHLTVAARQIATLIDVLESALAQATARNGDHQLQSVLLGALAPAKQAAGQKEAAAALWVRVVMLQPGNSTATGALAKVLIEIGSPDLLSTTIQQIAGGQSGALVDVLVALSQELTSRRAAGQAPALQRMVEKLQSVDSSTWSVPGRHALQALVSAWTKPAGEAPASAPATMAVQPADADSSPGS